LPKSGLKPADPVMFVTVALILRQAGVVGSAILARRAIKLDPLVAPMCELYACSGASRSHCVRSIWFSHTPQYMNPSTCGSST